MPLSFIMTSLWVFIGATFRENLVSRKSGSGWSWFLSIYEACRLKNRYEQRNRTSLVVWWCETSKDRRSLVVSNRSAAFCLQRLGSISDIVHNKFQTRTKYRSWLVLISRQGLASFTARWWEINVIKYVYNVWTGYGLSVRPRPLFIFFESNS